LVRPPAAAGFSLAELLVVMTLMAMFLGMAMPRMMGFSSDEQMRTAARRLAALSLEAHSEAVTKSRPWFYCIDFDRRRVWMSTVRPGREGDAGRESDYYHLPRGVRLVDAEHAAEGLVKEGRISFGYWPQGGSEPGALHLESEKGDQLTLFLRPYFGRTEIEEGYLREDYL
jgi:prepilin-type N-terminal cleavage/methylation domain-containing protein